jgi:hypothetical protein
MVAGGRIYGSRYRKAGYEKRILDWRLRVGTRDMKGY